MDGRLKYFMNVNSSNVRVLFLWGENIGMKDESHLQLEINQMAGHRTEKCREMRLSPLIKLKIGISLVKNFVCLSKNQEYPKTK